MESIELPALDQEQGEVSQALARVIADQIDQTGPMPFAEYMHRCLYEPGLGYYVNGLKKIGASGDFVTAPEISADLAQCVAAQTAEVFAVAGTGDVLEFGGGSGRFVVDVLRELDRAGALPARYYILDVSPDLKQQQERLVHSSLPAELAERVEWVDSFVEDFRGVAIANELFDAFPVERFRVVEGEIRQLCVTWCEDGFSFTEVVNDQTSNYVRQLFTGGLGSMPSTYQSEFCPVVMPWWKSLADSFSSGLVLVLDYGCERARYYSALRAAGSTRCFFRHTVHSDPLIFPGVQDITADVDFTGVAEAAVSSGFALEGYTTMTQFMLSLGAIEQHASRIAGFTEKQKINATGRLKQVIMPEEMGERFMVAGFSRNIEPALQGFSQGDQSRLL